MQTFFIVDGARVHIDTTRKQLPDGCSNILLLLDGNHRQALHRQFAKYRIRSTPWFWMAEPVEQFIAERNPAFKPSDAFYSHIVRQIERDDECGWTARQIITDPYFPRQSSALHFLLAYFQYRSRDGERMREGLKKLHSGWREVRSVRGAAR